MPPSPDEPNLPDLTQHAINWLIKLRADNISDQDMHGFADWLSQDAAHSAAFAQAEDMFNDMVAAGTSLRQKLSNAVDASKHKETSFSIRDDCMNAGGKATSGTVAEKAGMRVVQSSSYIPHPNHLPEGEGIFRDSHKPAQAIGSVITANSAKNLKQQNFTKRWLALPLAFAAACLVAVLGVMPKQAHLFDAYLSDYHTGTGEQRDIALTDGSHLLLNTNSAVSVDYQDSLRIIKLHHGQVRFTVAKDSQRPFEVHSGGLSVRALGTVFEVYNKETGDFSVTVQEHAVSARLSTPEKITPSEQPQVIVVNEGQQLHYLGGKHLPAPKNSDISQLTAWQQQKLFINDRPLSEAIAELNRYRIGRIVVPDANLNNQRITGVFSLANPDETLHTLSTALALQETRLGSWWVVLHR